MKRSAIPAQLPLYGLQYVHVGHRGPVTGNAECAVCRVSLALADALTCGACPGWVDPAPPWALLTAVEAPPLEFEEAA